MKKVFWLSIVFMALAGCRETENIPLAASTFREGDIIFQESESAQSQAIQLATGSRYSHCGMVYEANGDYFVYEAIQPVQTTPLQEWIERGKDGHYVVKRLKNADSLLPPVVLKKMKRAGRRFNNKDYDLYFEWSNDRIYCSELVWKIYHKGAGIELSTPEKLGDFKLDHPAVTQKLAERYGKKIPLDEMVVSPEAIFDSKLLYTVRTQ